MSASRSLGLQLQLLEADHMGDPASPTCVGAAVACVGASPLGLFDLDQARLLRLMETFSGSAPPRADAFWPAAYAAGFFRVVGVDQWL